MAGVKLSRRKIAAYVADELLAGRDMFSQLAAYLVEAKRTRELALVVRDIEAALADRGVLLADVQSSRTLSDDAKNVVASFLLANIHNAERVVLRESVDSSLLGGVRIETPDQRLDATLRHRLNQLTASKI